SGDTSAFVAVLIGAPQDGDESVMDDVFRVARVMSNRYRSPHRENGGAIVELGDRTRVTLTNPAHDERVQPVGIGLGWASLLPQEGARVAVVVDSMVRLFSWHEQALGPDVPAWPEGGAGRGGSDEQMAGLHGHSRQTRGLAFSRPPGGSAFARTHGSRDR